MKNAGKKVYIVNLAALILDFQFGWAPDLKRKIQSNELECDQI